MGVFISHAAFDSFPNEKENKWEKVGNPPIPIQL